MCSAGQVSEAKRGRLGLHSATCLFLTFTFRKMTCLGPSAPPASQANSCTIVPNKAERERVCAWERDWVCMWRVTGLRMKARSKHTGPSTLDPNTVLALPMWFKKIAHVDWTTFIEELLCPSHCAMQFLLFHLTSFSQPPCKFMLLLPLYRQGMQSSGMPRNLSKVTAMGWEPWFSAFKYIGAEKPSAWKNLVVRSFI